MAITITGYDASVAVYELFEASFTIEGASFTNPYWVYDISPPTGIPNGTGITVDATFTKGAETIVVPCFYTLDCTRRTVGVGVAYGNEAITPSGTPHWMARWSPTSTGIWTCSITANDASGTMTSDEFTFTATTAVGHGFVKASSTDSRYFELSDGTPLIGVGVNAPNILSTYDADVKLAAYAANGVKVIRYWMDYRGWQSPFAGGNYPTNGGPQWDFSWGVVSTGGGAKAGDLFAAELVTGVDVKQTVNLLPGTYRYTGYIKTDSVVGNVNAHVGSNLSASVSGTQDWTQFSYTIAVATTANYSVGVGHNGSSGTAWFDDIELCKDLGGGVYSGTHLVKGDFDMQNYIDPIEAWKVDHIFQTAAEQGIYLKTIIADKQDDILGRISSTGTAVARSDDNYYSASDQPCRWIQQSYWRYITARWGAYTSAHSWEFCNEGNPFPGNGNHFEAANALATYIHAFDDNDRLCTTSFWHSLPMDFWKTSSCDYIDLHEYFGPTCAGTESHGPRMHVWADLNTNFSNYTLPLDTEQGTRNIISTDFHTGSKCYEIIAHDGAIDNNSNWAPGWENHFGCDPTHTYTIRYWAKGSNIGNAGGNLAWTRPRVNITWSAAYHENNYSGESDKQANLGTYDWTYFERTGIVPPADANTGNVAIDSTRSPSGSGDSYFRVDGLEIIDEMTGENLYLGGDFEDDRIDYDPALAIRKFGLLLNSYGSRISKPTVWGEAGIRGTVDENADILLDIGGLAYKKMIWAHTSAKNPNMLYWWTDAIDANNTWYHFKRFQDFMTGIPINNGHHIDSEATVSNSAMRAWGQKDLTNNTAHLWVDNTGYNWNAVVNSTAPSPATGDITVTGLADGDYTMELWDTDAGTYSTSTVNCTSNSITFAVNSLVSDTAVKLYEAGTPQNTVSNPVTFFMMF
jgi:hypothetical protein